MNVKERNMKCVDYATRGVIESLEHTRESMLGQCIVKVDLFPRSAIRANSMIFSEDESTILDDILPEITVEFIQNHWQMIRLLAARKYQRYIIPNTEGVYLGTFEEYQKIPNERLASIASGIQDLADAIADICVEQGGNSLRIDVQIKQLPSGNDTDEDENG